MDSKSEFELTRLAKDVSGMMEIIGESKDRILDIEESIQAQAKTLKQLNKKTNRVQRQSKGLSLDALAQLKAMKAQVTKLESHMLNDQLYMRNASQTIRDLTKELKQTVAANDC